MLHDFLKHLQQVKTEELNRIQHELEMVNEDFKKVKDNLANIEVNRFFFLRFFLENLNQIDTLKLMKSI